MSAPSSLARTDRTPQSPWWRERLSRLIPRGAFARGASQLVIGTIAGQAIVLLTAPLISRLYGPAEFGVLAVYAAVLSVTASLATLRYEVAVPLPRADGSASVMLVLAATVVVIVSALTGIGLLLWGDAMVAWTNTPELMPYLWTIPLGVLLTGVHGALTYWGLRKGAFSLIARTRFQQGLSMAGAQSLLGYLRVGPIGLIIGHLLGFCAGLISLWRFWSRTGTKSLRSWTLGRMQLRAKRYRDYPLYSSWGGVVNTAGLQLPVILFASSYSPAVAGLYLLANRVANAPVALVAEAVGKVFYVSAVEARRQGRLSELCLGLFTALLQVCLVPFVVIAIMSPEFFAVLFGSAWTEAGAYMQWLSLLMASVFVFAPLAMLYSVLYRHREDLYFQAVLFAARIAGILIGTQLGGPLMAIALFAGLASAVYCGFGFRLLVLAGVRSRDLVRVLARELVIGAVAGLVILALRFAVLPPAGSPIAIPHLFVLGVALALCVVVGLRVRRTLAILQRFGANAA